MNRAVETTAGQEHGEGQQHPVAIYLWIWALLFVFSTFSYLVDYFQLHGLLRWTLIITFMAVKAGCIVAIFMHMAWERLALKFAILIPPLCLLIAGMIPLQLSQAMPAPPEPTPPEPPGILKLGGAAVLNRASV